jgi:hypothetical protein
MCFAHLWNCGFFVIAIDPSLSPRIMVGNFCANPSSLNRFRNQCASRAASDKAIYSASVDERAITDCFFEYHVGKIVQPSQWGACHNGHLNCVVM